MQYSIYSQKDFKIVPWRNAQGSTTELIVKKLPSDENFIWRLSAAGVCNDGDFSDFSGYDRILVLTEGNGVVLNHSNGQKDNLLRRFDFASFSGDLKTFAKLVNGPVKDFNVMTRRDYCFSQVVVFKTHGTHDLNVDSSHLLVYAVDEDIDMEAGKTTGIKLQSGNLLHVTNPIKTIIDASSFLFKVFI